MPTPPPPVLAARYWGLATPAAPNPAESKFRGRAGDPHPRSWPRAGRPNLESRPERAPMRTGSGGGLCHSLPFIHESPAAGAFHRVPRLMTFGAAFVVCHQGGVCKLHT